MLEIKDLCVNYGQVEALSHVDIHVDKDEIVALVGSNGAGKSTLLKTISGQVKPRSGEILFQGTSVVGLPSYKVARLGIIQVPEGRKIFYKMSVRENLKLGAYNIRDKHLIQNTMDHVIELFPILGSRINQAGGTLSGGEQQMLAFGRAMMAQPKILLLDEPSLGLAPLVVEAVADIVLKIADTGIPILLVEQNASIALDISDRAYVLETGIINMTGDSEVLAEDDSIKKTYLGIS